MLVDMLKAVKDMLLISESDEIKATMAKITCARTIVEKLIAGMEVQGITTVFPETTPPGPGRVVEPSTTGAPPMPAQQKNAPTGQYKVIVDASRRLTQIKGLPDDAPIMLNGKRVLHKDAIGQTFEEIKIL